jgi:hypothetical protein
MKVFTEQNLRTAVLPKLKKKLNSKKGKDIPQQRSFSDHLGKHKNIIEGEDMNSAD